MPSIQATVLAPDVLRDFDRIIDPLARFDASLTGRIDEILEALRVLRHSPLIGRKVKGGSRELVMGSASHGYVSLYRLVPDIDVVFVLALRAQRESGCKRRR